jgi:peptidoglycan biosynthesis protein MviN/MurJ (putative lipid II flippase)
MRRRAILIFLLPIGIFLWLIGWSLYHTGSKDASGHAHTLHNSQTRQTLEITTILDEENLAEQF